MTGALIAVAAWFGWPVLASLVVIILVEFREWRLDRSMDEDAHRRIQEFELLESCWNLPTREPQA